jgi:hypothetical protein
MGIKILGNQDYRVQVAGRQWPPLARSFVAARTIGKQKAIAVMERPASFGIECLQPRKQTPSGLRVLFGRVAFYGRCS